MINLQEYHFTVSKMREFFVQKGYVEVPVQSRLSILAACEDPETISQFQFGDTVWPLPQTGQMWLEYELLKDPGVPGVFCISTSYRNEPDPIPGRHDFIFPMFEFEGRGTVEDLITLEKDLLTHLGFTSAIAKVGYTDVAKLYGVTDLEAKHETTMEQDFAPIIFLTKFPFASHPFWNMKHTGDNIFAKVDVILHGMETCGGAERSCNVEEMRQFFYGVSHGGYAKKLFSLFGQDRVEKELEDYLSFEMTPRFGTGIGVTRMIRAMKLEGILKERVETTV